VAEQFKEAIFDLVDELILMTGNVGIAEIIYNHSTKELAKLSILFDILIWYTPDNGNELLNQTKKWFLGNDQNKIELVLNMTNVYPCQPFDLLEKRLKEIQWLYPELRERCDYWIKSIEDRA